MYSRVLKWLPIPTPIQDTSILRLLLLLLFFQLGLAFLYLLLYRALELQGVRRRTLHPLGAAAHTKTVPPM